MPSPLSDETAEPARPGPFPDRVRLCFALYSANHAMNRLYAPLLAALDLTYPQYLVMVALWERDRRPVGEIARLLRLETNTLTPLLKRMEAAGLVTRARSAEDERVVVVSLTLKGEALRENAERVPDCVLAASGMAIEELDLLAREISALRDRLEAGGAERAAAICDGGAAGA